MPAECRPLLTFLPSRPDDDVTSVAAPLRSAVPARLQLRCVLAIGGSLGHFAV
jgi:hypothetical protein